MAWTREELDEALRKLDHDIGPMIASSIDAEHVWTTFKREASWIEQRAHRHFWYAAAQLDRLAISHQLIPRVRAMRMAPPPADAVQQRSAA